jgi:hypothetical protein
MITHWPDIVAIIRDAASQLFVMYILETVLGADLNVQKDRTIDLMSDASLRRLDKTSL